MTKAKILQCDTCGGLCKVVSSQETFTRYQCQQCGHIYELRSDIIVQEDLTFKNYLAALARQEEAEQLAAQQAQQAAYEANEKLRKDKQKLALETLRKRRKNSFNQEMLQGKYLLITGILMVIALFIFLGISWYGEHVKHEEELWNATHPEEIAKRFGRGPGAAHSK